MDSFNIKYKKHLYTIIPSDRNKPGRRSYFKVLKDDHEIGMLMQQDDESCCWKVNDGSLSEKELDFLSETIEAKLLLH